MPRQKSSEPASEVRQRQRAPSRYDNQGGACAAIAVETDQAQTQTPEMTGAGMVALRVRVIALENLMIELLATATDQQIVLAREMAGYISPRPGYTDHPMPIHAAAYIVCPWTVDP